MNGMGRLVRRVLMPLAVIALGARWFYLGVANGIQENCDPHCVTDGQVTTALWMFLVALGLWIGVLVVISLRRRHEEFRWPFR
jgi:hypothetical protein